MPTPTGSKKNRRARNQEESAATRFGGRRQPGSGNQWHSRGDVRVDDFLLLEAKHTVGKSISITRKIVEKIMSEAANGGQDYWAVEALIVPHNLYLYAVDPHLIFAAEQHLMSLPDTQQEHIGSKKSLTVSIRNGREPFVEVCTQWHTNFYLVGKNLMETIVRTVQQDPPFLDVGRLLYYYHGVDMNRKPNERGVGIVGGSDLGKCKRKSWYRLTGAEPNYTFSAQTRMVFQIGHAVHDYIQHTLRVLFGPVFRAEIPVSIPEYNFRGSVDGDFDLDQLGDAYEPPEWITDETLHFVEKIIDAVGRGHKLMVEIKTCSSPVKAPLPEHITQATAYAIAGEYTHVCFIYVQKTNGTILSFVRRVEPKSIVYRKVMNELAYLKEKTVANEEPPRQISKRACGDCPYRRLCQPGV